MKNHCSTFAWSKIFFGMLVLVVVAGSAGAFTPQEALKDDPVLALYLRPGNAYPQVLDKIRQFEESQNESFKQLVQRLFDAVPAVLKGKETSQFEGFLKLAIDFEEQKVFEPSGNLWFSINGDLMPYLQWDADAKPKLLYEFFQRLSVMPFPPAEVKDDSLVYRFFPVFGPKKNALVFEVKKNGLFVHPLSPTTGSPMEKWNEFATFIENPDMVMSLEIDLEKLFRMTTRWANPEAGTLLPDPRFRSLDRGRIFLTKQGGQVLMAVSEKERRERAKRFFEAVLKRLTDLPENLQPVLGTKKALDCFKVVEQGDWTGIAIDHADPVEMLFAGRTLWHLGKGLIIPLIQRMGGPLGKFIFPR